MPCARRSHDGQLCGQDLDCPDQLGVDKCREPDPLAGFHSLGLRKGGHETDRGASFHAVEKNFCQGLDVLARLVCGEFANLNHENRITVSKIRFGEATTADDWPDVCRIHEEGVAIGVATFEIAAPTWEQWDAARLPHSRLIASGDGRVPGWAALSAISQRSCYAGVAEVAVYVGAAARGRGVGRALLEAVITSAETHGIWTLQGATIAANTASLALQARCGFREWGGANVSLNGMVCGTIPF